MDDSIVRGTQLRETVDFLYEQRRQGCAHALRLSAHHVRLQVSEFLPVQLRNGAALPGRTIQELEGDEGCKHLDEYTDGTTRAGQDALLKTICEQVGI